MFFTAMGNSKGFTIIETAMAMSIVVIGLVGSYLLLAGIQATREHRVQVTQSQQEARNIVERIVRDLRESSLDQVWIDSTYGTPDSIVFFTPRDEQGAFSVYSEVDNAGKPLAGYGRPVWQGTIAYSLDPYSNCIYRYQLPELMSDINEIEYYWEGEVISRRVERLLFSQTNDMLAISIRTFQDTELGSGQKTKSYSDFYTMVEFRN